MTVFLSGDLGAGKTTLVRGLLRALGYTGKVKSPTYTLVELYKLSRLCLYHFDFYRFVDPEELTQAGFRDDFNADNLCLVEWPERAEALLPKPDMQILLRVDGSGRQVEVRAETAQGEQCLEQLKNLSHGIG